jgi:hypothetical protein
MCVRTPSFAFAMHHHRWSSPSSFFMSSSGEQVGLLPPQGFTPIVV